MAAARQAAQYRGHVQATVRSHDPQTGAGTVLTDDGVQLSYSGKVFADAGLRHLRLGQRVRIEITGEGADTTVTGIAFYTMH